MQKLQCSCGSWRVSLECGFFYALLNHHWTQKLHCNQCSWKVSLQCGFFHALSNLQRMQKLFCNRCSLMFCIQSEIFHALSNLHLTQKLSCICGSSRFFSGVCFLLCTFKSSQDAKAVLHWMQLKGLYPVWDISCTFKSSNFFLSCQSVCGLNDQFV